MTRVAGYILAIGIMTAALPARATEVSVRLSTREAYVGVPIVLRVTVEDGQPDQNPSVPAINGATMRLAGEPSQSSRTTIINGKVTQHVSVSYDYQVTPQRAGRITIPAIEVTVAGKKYKTKPQVIVVSRSETGDLLFAEVRGARDSVYVGESLEVTLQIWLRPYQNAQHQVTLTEGNMWDLVDLNASQWGLFGETLQQMLQRRQRPRGKEVLRKDSQGNDHSYFLYEVTRTIWPERPGELDVGEINIVVNYPTGVERGQGFFDRDRLMLTGSRPVAVQVQTGPVAIKPIPQEGRPAWFRGAVGQYKISATAKPDEVTVGDPITLTLTISGTGRLDQLQPPPLPDLPELTRDFKVPTDPLAGEVEGDKKRFTQSIRAVSDTVKAIPAIPFAYFDPREGKFNTVRTDPIPITVKPADKLSSGQVVEATAKGPASRTLTEVSGGILANYTSEDEILSQQDVRPGWVLLVLMCAPPIVFGVCWVVQSRRNRMQQDVAFARRRTARRAARSRIHHRGEKDLPAAVLAAVGGYVADRCNLPAGSLTRAEIALHMGERGVKPGVCEQVDTLLAACEQTHYAGTAGLDPKELVATAERCIGLLERERF